MVACLADAHLREPMVRFNIRLNGPPPLETELDYRFELDGDAQRMRFAIGEEDAPVLTGWAATSCDDPVVPAQTVAELAARATLDGRERSRFDEYAHPDNGEFSECFGCGTHNGFGLGLKTRPINDRQAWIDWTPQVRWHDNGMVSALVAIAALDCTSAIPLHALGYMAEHETSLLGTYDGQMHRRPPVRDDGSYRIVTSPRRRDGRKVYADIGLFDPEGTVYITGCATWIVLAAE